MATSYTSLLGFALPVTGELDGTWGTTVNDSITELVEDAIAATATTSVAGGDWTLTTTGSGAANQARCAILIPTGSPGVSRNIIAPSQSKAYIVINQSDAAVVLKGAATTGVTIATGTKALCAWNGSDFVIVGTADLGNVSGTLAVSKGGTGQTSYTDGQLLIGNTTGNTLTKATLTQGSGVTITNGNGSITISATGSGGDAVLANNNAFTGANTFYNATGQTFGTGTSTQDGIILTGRAGGTNTYRITLTPATLSASTTLTLPNTTTTVAGLGVSSQVFTTAQTFRAASAVRSEAASTQDAIVVAGRAGGTSSYAVTLTPDTLSASRTVTLPDGGGNYTLGYRNIPAVGTKTSSYTLAVADIGKYVQVGSGGSITIPNATFAEGDAISIFNNTTGDITVTCTIATAYIAGTNEDKASVTLATRGVATILFISSTVCVISGNVT